MIKQAEQWIAKHWFYQTVREAWTVGSDLKSNRPKVDKINAFAGFNYSF